MDQEVKDEVGGKEEEKVETPLTPEEMRKKEHDLYVAATKLVQEIAQGGWSCEGPADVDEALRALARFLVVDHNQNNFIFGKLLTPKRIITP